MFGGVLISHPALLLEALPCDIGVPYLVTILLSHNRKGSMSPRIIGYLEKADIISNLVN